MTIREQIAKKRKPCVLGGIIGAASFLAGIALQHAVGRDPSFAWFVGRWPIGDIAAIGLIILGVFILVVSTTIYSMRKSCAHCGRDMGPSNFRKINYCPFCGTHLDSELSTDGVVTATAARQQRKEWLQHMAYIATTLLSIALFIYIVILHARILQLESDRNLNAKAVGSYYARACRSPTGEESMRRIFKVRLSRAERANCLGRLFLPPNEKNYTQTVLDTFEKELLLKQGRMPSTDGTTNQINHVTR
jgi:hypothetical protein